MGTGSIGILLLCSLVGEGVPLDVRNRRIDCSFVGLSSYSSILLTSGGLWPQVNSDEFLLFLISFDCFLLGRGIGSMFVATNILGRGIGSMFVATNILS